MRLTVVSLPVVVPVALPFMLEPPLLVVVPPLLFILVAPPLFVPPLMEEPPFIVSIPLAMLVVELVVVLDDESELLPLVALPLQLHSQRDKPLIKNTFFIKNFGV